MIDSSHSWASMIQLVDLRKEIKKEANGMNETKMMIEFKLFVCGTGPNFEDFYHFKVYFLDENKNIISFYDSLPKKTINKEIWQALSFHLLFNYQKENKKQEKIEKELLYKEIKNLILENFEKNYEIANLEEIFKKNPLSNVVPSFAFIEIKAKDSEYWAGKLI